MFRTIATSLCLLFGLAIGVGSSQQVNPTTDIRWGAASGCGTSGTVFTPFSSSCASITSLLGYTPAHSGANTDITSIIGNAQTATALKTTPNLCSAGQAATGVDASGNAQGCFTPSGGGGTTVQTGGYIPVITMTNTSDNGNYASQGICYVGNCHGGTPGGVDAPAAVSATYGTVSSPPAGDGTGLTLSVTTNATSTQTNVLYSNFYGVCDNCTQVQDDFWMKTGSTIGSSYEFDSGIQDKTDNILFMFGWQIKANGVVQIDNEGVGWANTTANIGTLAANTWYHIVVTEHRVIGDTACGGKPCENFDSIQINGTTYQINQQVASTTLAASWGAKTFDQKQVDVGSTSGSAKTVTATYTANNVTFSTGTPTSTNGTGLTGDLFSDNFDGTNALTGLTATGTPVLSQTNVYTSPQAVDFGPGGNYYTASLANSATTLYVRFYLQVNTVGTDTTNSIFALYNGTTNLYALYLNKTNNVLEYFNHVDGTNAAVSATPLTSGTYHYIEMSWTADPAAGAVTVKIDGTAVYTGTSLNTGSSAANTIRFGGLTAGTATWDVSLDNIDVSDSGFLGPVNIISDSSSGGSPTGTAGGDLSGSYPNPGVAQLNGVAPPASAPVVGTNSSRQLVSVTASAISTYLQSLSGCGTVGNVLSPASGTCVANGTGGTMVYPGAGVPKSLGTSWDTSYQVGLSANDLVQLNSFAALPAINAANLTGISPSQVGLGSVTNDTQTKASVVPNTLPSAAQVMVGNSGGTGYSPVTISGDCSITFAGVATCSKSGGTLFGSAAFSSTSAFDAAGAASTAQSTAETYAANSSNQSSGTLPAGRLPALTGDCSTTAGSASTVCTKTNGAAFGSLAVLNAVPVAPLTTTTGAGPVTVSGNTGYYYNDHGALTYNLPTITSGLVGAQYCFRNFTGISGVITLQLPASTTVDRNGATGTTAGHLISSGALGDAACVVAVSTTEYIAYIQAGTWTNP